MGVQLLTAVTVFSWSDIAKSLAFYRDRLGFTVDFQMDVFPYAGVSRDGMTLHLDAGTHEFVRKPTYCRFHINGVDDLFTEYDPRGIVKPNERLATLPHGLRQFSILDNDGNPITFAEPVA